MSETTTLGPYVAGEIPEPWEHDFIDINGAAIDITGFAVRVTYRLGRSAQVVRTGALTTPAAGKAAYQWIAADVATAGLMRGEMTVGDGSHRYARSFTMRIKSPAGGSLPTI